MIGYKAMEKRYSFLKEFEGSEKLLELIKLVVMQPTATSKEYAKILHKDQMTIEGRFSEIYRILGITSEYEKKERINRISLLEQCQDAFCYMRNN